MARITVESGAWSVLARPERTARGLTDEYTGPGPVAADGDGELTLTLPSTAAGRRLDAVLADLLPDWSRTRLQAWIAAGRVLVDGAPPRQRDPVRGGEQVAVRPLIEPQQRVQAQAMALAIVHQDEHLLVLDKPAGLVVHPAAGHADGTLQNALLHHDPALEQLPRHGIVHRLDKDTSGLLAVARTLRAHRALVAQLARRSMHREYRALVVGELTAGGRIDAPIGRHPTRRTAMAVVPNGRPAVTHYRVLRRFAGLTLVAVRLESGRTHQIRVHLAHRGHPLVGDPLYGGRPRPPAGLGEAARRAVEAFPRQALHAIRLGLQHPATGEDLVFAAPMAADLAALLEVLAADAAGPDRRWQPS